MDKEKIKVKIVDCIDMFQEVYGETTTEGEIQAAATLLLADELHALNETQQAILAVECEMLKVPEEKPKGEQTTLSRSVLTTIPEPQLIDALKKLSGAASVELTANPAKQTLSVLFVFDNTDRILVTAPFSMAEVGIKDFTTRMQKALDYGHVRAREERDAGNAMIRVQVRMEEVEEGTKARVRNCHD